MNTNIQSYSNELVKKYQELLNLREWKISITLQSDAQYRRAHGKRFFEASNGCAAIHQLEKRAEIFVKASLPPEALWNSIVHEMVHIPLNHMYVVGLTAFDNIENIKKRREFKRDWEHHLECAVARVTSGFYKLE
ncbi:MAG: hypothetical protein WCP10_15120 [Desulfuromonadales bacterium]